MPYKIAIIGSGVVGKGTGSGMEQLGHDVYYYDKDAKKLAELAKQGLHTAVALDEAVNFTDMSIICVPTPYVDGIDLSYLKDAVTGIGEALKRKKEWHLVVIKSTVIPLTCDNVVIPILEKCGSNWGLCMNPEFLTEINTTWTDDTRFKRDFWCKERIVIGELDNRSGYMLEQIYKPIGAPIYRVSLKTAEMTKYAANMLLLTKISYWNELFLICKKIGIDSHKVAEITALDARLGKYGTIHGMAAGGTCLMKDISAFCKEFKKTTDYQEYPSVLLETLSINKYMADNYGIRE